MYASKKAFTMIEMIFVIVILGILGSVAISKMAVTRDDAMIAKGRAQVSAIRNAIAIVKNKHMLQGNINPPSALDDATTAIGQELFDGNSSVGELLDYPLYAKNENGHWKKLNIANNTYAYKVMNNDVNFTYNNSNGTFDCNHDEENCKDLTE